MLTTFIGLMKENGFKLGKEISRRYPAQTPTDMDYTDDIAHRSNTPPQAESLLYCFERAAAGISFYFNTDWTE